MAWFRFAPKRFFKGRKPDAADTRTSGANPGNSYKRLKNLAGHERGNVTMVVGLLAVPLVVAIGGGVDFSHINTLRTQLQDASDAAVLAAAWSKDASETGMKAVADQVLQQNIANSDIGTVTTLLSKTDYASGSAIQYKASANVPTYFLGLIGMDTVAINTLSKSDATIRNTEIAFVLDSTGSMASSSKMTNLKNSVDAMLLGLLDADGKNSGNTKVAIVPFDTQVKIAASTSLSYIDYGQASNSEACSSGTNSNLCKVLIDSYDKVCMQASDVAVCKGRAKVNYKTYSSNGKNYYETKVYAYEGSSPSYTLYTFTEILQVQSGTDTVESPSLTKATVSNLNTYNSTPNGFTAMATSVLTYPVSYAGGYDARAAMSYVVDSYGDDKWVSLPAVAANRAAWTGCVVDRNQSYDVSAAPAVAGTPDSLYPARPCNNSTLVSASGLSTDIASARAKVQTLQPSGNTNLTIGLQWGMEMLSPDEPFGGGSAWKTPLYAKYIILVTDGDNTQNRWSTSQSAIDARTALACQAAKDKGIVVYTVRVMDGNSDLLKACASQTSYFYDLSTASQLSATMTSILKSIRKIRLSQ